MDCDYILRYCFFELKVCIEVFGNDIYKGWFGDEVYVYFGVVVQEFGDDFLNK